MLKRVTVALLLVAMSTGCLGRNGLKRKVEKMNLSVTENRWGREGTFVALQVLWVYRICLVLDLFIFNSIEFWSGENPITGESPLVDLPMSDVEKISFNDVEKARIQKLSSTEAKLYLDFQNGDELTFDVLRTDASYTISYQGREFFQGQLKDAI
jgi:hypothetical protein